MVLFLILFLVFAIVAAACWFQGLWSCAIIIINLLLAGLIATNFYEPLADWIDSLMKDPGSSVYLDPAMLWLLFVVTYFILRMVTQGLSENDIYFIKPVELAGRSVLAIWAAWIFTCFTAFTMMTAPIGGSPLGAWSEPDASSFLFLSPERQWMALAQSRSMGALSRGKFSSPATSPDGNVEVFDPNSEYTFKYYAKRKKAEQ